MLSHSDSLSWHWANQPLPYPNNDECQARKWQVSILKSLVWLDSKMRGPDLNLRSSDSPISQAGRRALLLIQPSQLVRTTTTSTIYARIFNGASWSNSNTPCRSSRYREPLKQSDIGQWLMTMSALVEFEHSSVWGSCGEEFLQQLDLSTTTVQVTQRSSITASWAFWCNMMDFYIYTVTVAY